MKFYRHALLELVGNPRFALMLVINLGLGLAGFVALDAFKASVEHTMQARSKQILGADLGISARRPLTQTEYQQVSALLPENMVSARTTEFYSMVSTPGEDTRLVKIKAVSPDYPFYGSVSFQNGDQQTQPFRALNNKPVVWIYQELKDQLGINTGDMLQLGNQRFEVTRVILEDSTAGLGASFAPTLYMGQAYLESTGLITQGSVAWHSVLYQLPGQSNNDLNGFKQTIFANANAQDLRVYTHQEASEQMSRLLQRLNDYLGLVAVVALMLAAVGTGFLYRSFFASRRTQVATLLALGATSRQATLYHLIQLLVLGFCSGLVAIGLGLGLAPVVKYLTAELLTISFDFAVPVASCILAFMLGIMGSFVVGLPFLLEVRAESAAILLKGLQQNSYKKTTVLQWFAWLPGILALWGLSLWQSQSFWVGTLFFVSLLMTAALLAGVFALALKLMANQRWQGLPYPVKFALRDLVGHPGTSIACFLALGLGAVLVNLVPQVQGSLQQELAAPETSKLPSLFMFDIQESQLAEIQRYLHEAQVKVTQVAPMIRARLITVNGQPFDKGKGAGQGLSREEQREMRFRNRGFNLSYRNGLSDSETLYAGEPIQGAYDPESQEMPFISVERRFADRLNLAIGDQLTFDIEGVSVEGRIQNLRSVRWTSFQPNFFIQFQPGVLESAPKMFIVTVESLSQPMKTKIQKGLVKIASNVSMIDVTRLVKRLTEIIGQMSLALSAMAILCFIAGLVVVYSIAQHQAERQRWQIGLLKVAGASFAGVLKKVALQFLILGLFAALLGVAVSVILSYVLSAYLFESLWVFHWQTPLVSFFSIVLLTLVISLLASYRALQVRPAQLLSSA